MPYSTTKLNSNKRTKKKKQEPCPSDYQICIHKTKQSTHYNQITNRQYQIQLMYRIFLVYLKSKSNIVIYVCTQHITTKIHIKMNIIDQRKAQKKDGKIKLVNTFNLFPLMCLYGFIWICIIPTTQNYSRYVSKNIQYIPQKLLELLFICNLLKTRYNLKLLPFFFSFIKTVYKLTSST